MYKSFCGLAVALAAVVAVPAGAFAHHPGGVGNSGDAGPINTISATTLDQGHLVAGITIDYAAQRTVSDPDLIAATAAKNDGVHGLRTLQAYALSAAYGLTNDLSVGVRLPYVERTGIRAAEDDGTGTYAVVDHGGSTGIGDLTVLGQYRFVNDQANRFELAALFGVIAPTGPTHRLSKQGELLDAEFQPGSGAWSGMLGLAATKRVGQWSFDANVLYVRTGEGTQGSNLGDQLLANAALSYRVTGFMSAHHDGPMYHGGIPHHHEEPAGGPKLDLVLELNGEFHTKQSRYGIADANSGGTNVYLSPGVRLSQDKWSGFVSVGVPVVKDTNGIQPEPDWRIRTGIGVAF